MKRAVYLINNNKSSYDQGRVCARLIEGMRVVGNDKQTLVWYPNPCVPVADVMATSRCGGAAARRCGGDRD